MCVDIYYDCEGDEVGMTGVLILRLVCRGEILFSSFLKGGRDKYEVSKMPVGKMPFVWIPMYTVGIYRWTSMDRHRPVKKKS